VLKAGHPRIHGSTFCRDNVSRPIIGPTYPLRIRVAIRNNIFKAYRNGMQARIEN
jgi:hypothetical protein